MDTSAMGTAHSSNCPCKQCQKQASCARGLKLAWLNRSYGLARGEEQRQAAGSQLLPRWLQSFGVASDTLVHRALARKAPRTSQIWHGRALPRGIEKAGTSLRSSISSQTTELQALREVAGQARTTAAAPTAGSGYCGEIGVPDKASFLLNRKRIDRSFLFFPILYCLSIGKYFLSVSTPGLAWGRMEFDSNRNGTPFQAEWTDRSILQLGADALFWPAYPCRERTDH